MFPWLDSASRPAVRKRTFLLASVAAFLILTAVSAAAGTRAGAVPAVTINYRQSSCVQMPLSGTGNVRFFIQLVNTSSRPAAFAKNIRFVWLRPDGWKDSWLNTISGGELKVPANRGKRYYADFGADPTKLILRCALKIGLSDALHHVKVLR
jgi:hypothetical protein